MAHPVDSTVELKYAQMSAFQKIVWWAKLLVALITFGFAFPHIMEARLKDETYMSRR